ncbi:MAG TPA: hypothetical protein VF659_20635 [Pyrinomonadaceae bacterium]|jgi:hypothetical protein
MSYKIENVKTETWHRIMGDLRAEGFEEIYIYAGADAGVDYSRYDLRHRDGGELIIFEWDNWSEGEIKADPSRLESLRERYRLPGTVEA